MESGLLLYCEVPKYIKDLRKKYDIHIALPAHITLCYLNNLYNENELIKKLENNKSFTITFDEIIKKESIIYLKPNNIKKIETLANKIKNNIRKLPKSGFHLTLGYNNYNNVSISEIDLLKLNLPLTCNINKIWLVKRNKNISDKWYRSKTIYLEN